MPEITLEQALKLVTFKYENFGRWVVLDVCGNVRGNVRGDVSGNVCGDVRCDVRGNVLGCVHGTVCGTIGERQWQFVETPLEKLKRLVESDAPKDQVLAALKEVA